MTELEAIVPTLPDEKRLGLLSKAGLYLRTIRHMKASQIFYYVIRRGLPPRRVPLVPAPEIRRDFKLEPPILAHSTLSESGSFRCMNETRCVITGNNVDWHPASTPRLWRYHLHYFDFLRQPDLPEELKLRLVEDWIDNNPQGTETAWEPYTCSLRVVNWIFWIATLETLETEIRSKVADSLFQQYRWLRRNDERHILANHYFENLKAIFFAEYIFGQRRAFAHTKRALMRQVEEQFLDDGSHFECSPSYHCRMTENILDIQNLTRHDMKDFASGSQGLLRRTVENCFLWLESITFPDESIPLLNDSTEDAASSPQQLRAYADRLGLSVPRNCLHATKANTASGTFSIRSNQDMLVITCADAQPSYQPGHWHSDLLSFELMLKGRPIVVDSGVPTYEEGPLRSFSRSTHAHNTVSIDSRNQAELWAAFRAGRRPQRIKASLTESLETRTFVGAYRVYCPAGTVTHQRTIRVTCPADNMASIKVEDDIDGYGTHDLESLIHLHPDVHPVNLEPNVIALRIEDAVVAILRFDPDLTPSLRRHCYSPKFGVSHANYTIVLSKAGHLPEKLGYEFEVPAEP